MGYLQYLQCFISSPSAGVVYILVKNVYFPWLFSQYCSVLVNFVFVLCRNRRFYHKFLHGYVFNIRYFLYVVVFYVVAEFVAALSIIF